jgi:hypothetical protein
MDTISRHPPAPRRRLILLRYVLPLVGLVVLAVHAAGPVNLL